MQSPFPTSPPRHEGRSQVKYRVTSSLVSKAEVRCLPQHPVRELIKPTQPGDPCCQAVSSQGRASYGPSTVPDTLAPNMNLPMLCNPVSAFSGNLSPPSPGRGSLAFELQQIIQGFFQFLNMNLRLIQYLPLRTETLLKRQPLPAETNFFYGPFSV